MPNIWPWRKFDPCVLESITPRGREPEPPPPPTLQERFDEAKRKWEEADAASVAAYVPPANPYRIIWVERWGAYVAEAAYPHNSDNYDRWVLRRGGTIRAAPWEQRYALDHFFGEKRNQPKTETRWEQMSFLLKGNERAQSGFATIEEAAEALRQRLHPTRTILYLNAEGIAVEEPPPLLEGEPIVVTTGEKPLWEVSDASPEMS